MATDTRGLVEELHEALATAEVSAIASLYAADAELVRYDGAAKGPDEIGAFFGRYLATHGQYKLDRIVDFRSVDDVILWDAMVETNAGLLLTYDVIILNDDGKILRHVPATRGYWGR
jgi:hypothetical protein